MRALRLCLVGTVTLALLGGMSSAVATQASEAIEAKQVERAWATIRDGVFVDEAEWEERLFGFDAGDKKQARKLRRIVRNHLALLQDAPNYACYAAAHAAAMTAADALDRSLTDILKGRRRRGETTFWEGQGLVNEYWELRGEVDCSTADAMESLPDATPLELVEPTLEPTPEPFPEPTTDTTAQDLAPAVGAFRPAGALTEPRVFATTTLLPDGRVLVIGGATGYDEYEGDAAPVGPAEVWIAATESFEPAGALLDPRVGHSSTLLRDGRVLVVGGGGSEPGALTAAAEIWDPATSTFAPSGPLAQPRYNHSATLLPDGRVLVIGGERDQDDPSRGSELVATAEIWDPTTGTFEAAGTLIEPRLQHTATLLPDGRVFVDGGWSDSDAHASAEIWDPVTASLSPAGVLTEPRLDHTSTLLPDGRVILIGGSNYGSSALWVEVWDPASESFRRAGRTAAARAFGHTSTLLPDGRVLVIGGSDVDGWSASAEVWDPGSESFEPAGVLARGREHHTSTLLPDGRVLVVGGVDWDGYVDLAEVWDPATASFSPAGRLADGRLFHEAVPLPDGRVLVMGGSVLSDDEPFEAPAAAAEIWEPIAADTKEGGAS